MAVKNSVVSDTVHGNIVMTGLEKRIISHVIFNRLHDVYQNSTVYLTFPCNRTKRFEHSLGTMKLCSDIFCSAIQNTNVILRNEFLSLFKKELETMINEIKTTKTSKYSIKIGGRAVVIENAIPEAYEESQVFLNTPINLGDNNTTYYILLQALRISALLHDIGHPPYSHISEFALGKISSEFINNKSHARIIEFNNIMNQFYGQEKKVSKNKVKEKESNTKKALHEQMGDKIVDIILIDTISNLDEEDAFKGSVKLKRQIFEILVSECVQKILTNSGLFDTIHRIVDGTLDGDRLDYVTRDAINSGLNKGMIEYDRLSSSMVEDYLNRRWDIYKNIIFHHRVIKTDYLLQGCIEQLSRAYLTGDIEEETANSNCDLLPSNISGLWKALKNSTNKDFAYAICQWDDAWLMTVLKKHYFEKFINDANKYKILSKQLSELLTNKKQYFSVIKRLEDFLIVDNSISRYFYENKDILQSKINELRELSKKCDKENTPSYIVDPFLTGIERILSTSMALYEKKSFHGLIYSHLKFDINTISKGGEDFKNVLDKIVQESIDVFPSNSIEDIFCVVKKYDIGLKKSLYFYDENQDKVFSVHDISSIAKILDLSYDTFPQFFIYILKTKEYQTISIDLKEYLETIGTKIAKYFYKKWIDKIEIKINQYKLN
ncbi:MAG: superfamily phosphohydrolase-like protein [Anaerocolumna sp.]|nr:superfamily phosphohydrolase-like protein [Anaerocolumna sp.]